MSDRKYLGQQATGPIKDLDLIEWDGGKIRITLAATEFTSLCPVTGQPDFGQIEICYYPDKFIVETKSLKLYLWSFRNEPSFVEPLIDQMADDLFRQIKPRQLTVTGSFNSRGGIELKASASRGEEI